jgi:hypothetical protein
LTALSVSPWIKLLSIHVSGALSAPSELDWRPTILCSYFETGCILGATCGVACTGGKPHREEPVRGEEPKPTWVLSPQDRHLMSKGNKLEFQRGILAAYCSPSTQAQLRDQA